MKVLSIKPVTLNQPTSFHRNVKSSVESGNCVSFYGYSGFVTKAIGVPIKSKEEYIKVLDRVYNYKLSDGEPLFNLEYNKKMYPKIKKEVEGVLLYAGYGDLSNDINRYLSGRDMRNMMPYQANDVVRAVDYSLQCLDKKYGKYSGFVYRQGVFPVGEHQFISTTSDPIIAATLRGGICFDKNLDFSIINAKKGHKINSFQKSMGVEFGEEEEEILLSRTSDFKEITNPQGNLLFAKRKFLNILESYTHTKLNPDKVRVFEEV